MTIFSFRPDSDETTRPDAAAPSPQVSYDPTNGTTSRGDLFITLKP